MENQGLADHRTLSHQTLKDARMIDDELKLLDAGQDLSMDRMARTMGLIMEGRVDQPRIAQLLTVLHEKGETVAEVAGAAAAMRRQMTPIRTTHTDFIDVVGTGGDCSGTFNISTAAALVTAAAGVPVAKHGNRAVTSRSGASDVLAALGVNIEAGIECVEACLDELGICFCFAPLYHKAMKHVAPVRQQLGIPTIFNVLGPLVNPAAAPFQLLGVGRPEMRPLLAEALTMLGTRRTLVVYGTDGLDEVTLGGRTDVTEATLRGLREFSWTPDDFGLEGSPIEALQVDGPEQSAEVIRGILAGRAGAPRNIVVANAAAALLTAAAGDSPLSCAKKAAEAIDSAAAADLLAKLVERTCEN
jgi:anthranilate phosphoribosyltransferase